MTSSSMTSLISFNTLLSITYGWNGIEMRRFRAQTELKADVSIKGLCQVICNAQYCACAMRPSKLNADISETVVARKLKFCVQSKE